MLQTMKESENFFFTEKFVIGLKVCVFKMSRYSCHHIPIAYSFLLPVSVTRVKRHSLTGRDTTMLRITSVSWMVRNYSVRPTL